MEKRVEKDRAALKVGVMVTSALLVFMVGLFFVADLRVNSGTKYLATFKFLGDLRVGATVKYAGGIEVGKVNRVYPKDGKAVVELLITDKNVRLRKDSEVVIYTAGLLGEKYIYIASNLGTGAELGSNESIEGTDPPNLDNTLIQMGRLMQTMDEVLGNPKARQAIYGSFEGIEKASNDLAAITGNSRVQIQKILSDLSKTTGNAQSVINSVNKLANSVDEITTSLNKQDLNSAIRNFNKTMKSLDEIALDVNKGKGALGVLLKDDQVAKDLKFLVEDLRRHPWKLLWKK